MLQAGVSVDSAIQSCVMRVATQQGKTPAQLEEYLLRLLKLRVKPSEQTFNALLRAHLAHGDAAAANRILDQMGAQGEGVCAFLPPVMWLKSCKGKALDLAQSTSMQGQSSNSMTTCVAKGAMSICVLSLTLSLRQ